MRPLDIVPPTQNEVFDDLKALRKAGLMKLTERRFDALEQAARAAGRIEENELAGPYVVESMLRDAVVKIGSDLGEAAAMSFGLQEGGRSDKPPQLRLMAAEVMNVSKEHFRHHYEPLICRQTAYLILAEVHDYRLKLARLQRDVRTPIGSRLAVEWLSRFEAMYAIWTPLTGVGGDLTGFRSTLLETDRPWDRDSDPNAHDSDNPDDDGYTQEIQAAGYVTDALYHFAVFLAALQDFEIRFGGLWLLPESQAETDISKAVHRAVLASPNNERDDSYLRRLLVKAPRRELHEFLSLMKDDKIGMAIHDEWQEWANTCKCESGHGARQGRELFPTPINNAGISDQCDMHMLISACNDFCLILDDGWDQIADWYHDAPKPIRHDQTAEEIYAQRENPLPAHLRSITTDR